MTRLSEAIGRLEMMSGFVRLMHLFRRNFPATFRQKIVDRGITPFAGEAEKVRSIEAFLMAMDSWFPVADWSADWVYEQLLDGVTIPYLPILTRAFADECEDLTCRLGYRVILAATRDELNDLTMRPLVGAPLGQYPQPADVAKRCAARRGQIQLLADAYRYVTGDTGSWFLDVSGEECTSSEMPCFEQCTIDALRCDWRRGRAILARCARFNDWIEADLSRIKPVVAILRTAARRERVRVMTNGQAIPQNRPLVEIMADLGAEPGDWTDEEGYAEEGFV